MVILINNMKKIFILTILAIILSNCEISPKKANATEYTIYDGFGRDIKYTPHIKDDITYHIYFSRGNNERSIFVVNHTKELLEVELLKKQLKDLEK